MIANPFLWFLQHQMWNLPERPIIDAGVMRAWERGYVAAERGLRARRAGAGARRPRAAHHAPRLPPLHAPPSRSGAPGRRRSSATSRTSRGRRRASGRRSRRRSARAIATGLLANDVVGFQTERYAHNFLRMVESFVPDATVDYEASDRAPAAAHDPRAALPDQHRRRGDPARGRLARRAAPRRPAARRGARAGHRPRRPARAIEEHPARLPRLRGAPAAPAAAARADQLPRLPGPVAHRAARVRPLRARGAERRRPHQRPLRHGPAGARCSCSTRTTTPRRWPASRSPTSCSSTRSSTA